MNRTQVSRTMFFALTLCLLFGSVLSAENDAVMNRQINRMEQYLYGAPREGSLSERLTQIHKDLLGRDSFQNNPLKTDNLYKFLFRGNETAPSLDMKLNYLEWVIFHENRRGKLGERLSALEKLSSGKPSEEPLAFRVEQLIQMNVESGIIALHRVKIPRGTQFSVRLEKALSSKTSRAGDDFSITLTKDLIFEKNILVLVKGGYAQGGIDQVKQAGRFGRSGRLKLLINDVFALDGSAIPVKVEGPADSIDKKKLGMAVGASAVGYIALGGPVGLVGGIFVKGREAEIPAGTEFIVESTEDLYVNGVVINRR